MGRRVVSGSGALELQWVPCRKSEAREMSLKHSVLKISRKDAAEA
jgi:hypothetical protein